MFSGEYRHQMDGKGRIRIPAKLKAKLGDKPFITRSSHKAHKCLLVIPTGQAEKLFDTAFGQEDVLTSDSRAMRMMASGGFDVEEDNAGRVLLTDTLIKHAGLEKNIVTIGAFNRVEIWSEKNWEAYQKEEEESAEAEDTTDE